MKITPLEIRQKTFEKNFRGYDKDEVTGYLQILSQEWEKMMDENKELSIKLKSAEREVEKLREVENSLFKTLKTAEDTGANIMDQATKAADLHMRETELKTEAMLNDARNKARDIIEEAEIHSKDTYDEIEGQVKSLAKLYRTLEDLRDDLISEVKAITTEVNIKIDRAQSQVKHFDVDQQLIEIRKSSVKSNLTRKKPVTKEESKPEPEETKDNKNINASSEPKDQESSKTPETVKPEPVNKPKEENSENQEEKRNKEEGSFFDEID